MEAETRRSLAGFGAGVVTTLAAFAALSGAGVVATRLLLDPSPASVRTRAALIGGACALVVACAAGGWVASALGRRRGPGAGVAGGLASAIVALLLLAGLAWSLLRESADFHSVGVALGWVEIPEDSFRRPDLPVAPAYATPPAVPPTIVPEEIALRRTVDTIAYGAVIVLAATGAAGLGGLAGSGHARPATGPAPGAGGDRGLAPQRRPLLPDPATGMLVLALVATPLLSLIAAGDGTLPGDLVVARWLQDLDGPVPLTLARLADWVGTVPGLAAVAAILVALFVGAGRPWPAVLVLSAVLARSLNPYLKRLLDSPRPSDELVQVTERASGLGFPSGHVMGVTLLYGTIIALADEGIPGPLPRRLIQAGALAVILVTGFGRVHTGAHWPSDVLGGYLWGALVLLVLLRLRRLAWSAERRIARPERHRGTG